MTSYHNTALLLGALDIVADIYRDVFKARWDKISDSPWADTKQNATSFLACCKSVKLNKTQEKVFATGNVKSFDLSLLSVVLRGLKDRTVKGKRENALLLKIVDIRNSVAHATGGIELDNFNKMWKDLEKYVGDLKHDVSSLRDLCNSKKLPLNINQTESKEMLDLKKQGNTFLAQSKHTEALICYSKAIQIPGLNKMEQSILHCNKAHAHTLIASKTQSNKEREEHLDIARVDAKMAKALTPSWFRPYYRIGRIFHLRKKYNQAIENFNIALAIDPGNKEIIDAKAICTSELERFKRAEHMDPRYIPSSIRHENYQKDGLLSFSDAQIIALMKGKIMNTPEGFIMKAHAYRDGTLGYPQDFQKAKELYAKAAQKGSAEGMHNLGVFYANGYCGAIDLKEAVLWWNKAANQGFWDNGHENIGVKEAENALGLVYLDGLGVEKDLHKALNFFEKSAQHGDPGGINNLGRLYLYGKGVAADLNKARMYFKASSMKGDTNAMVNLGRIELMDLNFKEAKKWLFRAAEKGNYTAQETVHEHKLDKMTEEELEPEIKDFMQQFKNLLFNNPSNHVKEKFPLPELQKCARYSRVAARMLEAKMHSMRAVMILASHGESILENLDEMRLFAKSAAQCYTITEIVFDATPLCLKVFNRLLEKDPFNTDAMLSFLVTSPDRLENLAFIKGWIAKGISFPRMYELQARDLVFLQRTAESIVAFNNAIKADTSDYSLYFYRGYANRIMMKSKDSIADFDIYLSHIDEDDRKIPNAHFGKTQAFLHLGDLSSAEKCYKIGCEKGKLLLPIFNFTEEAEEMEKKTEYLLHIFKLVDGPKKFSMSDLPSLPPTKDLPEEEKRFRDVRRIEIITTFREYTKNLQKLSEKRAGVNYATLPALKQQPAISSLANLTQLFIGDIDLQKDAVYKGHIIACSILGPFSVSVGAYTIVEDEKGDVEKIGLYNFGFKNSKEFEASFWVGKRISIINPYLRIGMDDKPFIRVDDPATVISHSQVRKEVCALCLSENSRLKCSKCTACYCSKKCQEIDCTVFKHKYICG